MEIFCFYTFIILFSSSLRAVEKDGYKDIPWGSSVDVVKAKIGKPKRSEFCSELYSTQADYDFLKNHNYYFPGSNLSSQKTNIIDRFEKDGLLTEHYKQVPGSEGCAVFFKGKFIAFYISIFGDTAKPDDVKANLISKYGKPIAESQAHGTRSNATVYTWKNLNTSIFGIFPTISAHGVTVYYISEEQTREILKFKRVVSNKLKAKSQRNQEKRKTDKLNSL